MALTKRYGLMESRKIHMIRIDDIIPNRHQPRSRFTPEGLNELSESIAQYGVLQPLTVRRNERGRYELVAGERRLRASRMAGLQEVPCIMVDVGEKESGLLALVENLQRCDLDFIEEAEGIQKLIRRFGLSQEEAARRLGKSQSAVANKLRLLRHPPDVIDAIRQFGLTERHARALLRLENPELRMPAIYYIADKHLNVSQSEAYIEQLLAGKPQKQTSSIKTLYAFRDIRLFLNSITRAVDGMNKTGIKAKLDRVDDNGEIELRIHIPSTR